MHVYGTIYHHTLPPHHLCFHLATTKMHLFRHFTPVLPVPFDGTDCANYFHFVVLEVAAYPFGHIKK